MLLVLFCLGDSISLASSVLSMKAKAVVWRAFQLVFFACFLERSQHCVSRLDLNFTYSFDTFPSPTIFIPSLYITQTGTSWDRSITGLYQWWLVTHPCLTSSLSLGSQLFPLTLSSILPPFTQLCTGLHSVSSPSIPGTGWPYWPYWRLVLYGNL